MSGGARQRLGGEKRLKRFDRPAYCLLAALLASGCSETERASVKGRVTLDSEPLDGATISFIPTSQGKGIAAWAKVQGGEFSIEAAQGPKCGDNRVEIRCVRPTGRTLPYAPHLDEFREIVPIKYNSQSQLTAKILPGENQSDFSLKSSSEP